MWFKGKLLLLTLIENQWNVNKLILRMLILLKVKTDKDLKSVTICNQWKKYANKIFFIKNIITNNIEWMHWVIKKTDFI